ncbi:hypothetical protein AB751O23_AM_00010, partial [Chlamydiales bacterium SCGC AB-751-O23]
MVFSTQTRKLSLESRLHFWALLGPFFILSAIFVSTFRFFPTGAYMPFLLLLTLPICWYKKKRLVFGAVGLCFVLFLFSYSRIPHEHRVWEMGMFFTVGLGLLITVLSLKEISKMLGDFQKEAESRLDNFLKVDQRLKKTESKSQIQEIELERQLEMAKQKVGQLYQEIEDRDKLVHLLKKEMDLKLEDNESLQQKLTKYDSSLDEWETVSRNLEKKLIEEQEAHGKQRSIFNELQEKMQGLNSSVKNERQVLQKEKQEFHVFQLTANQKQIEMKKLLDKNVNALKSLSQNVDELLKEKESLEKAFKDTEEKKKLYRNTLNETRVAKFQLKVNQTALRRELKKTLRNKKYPSSFDKKKKEDSSQSYEDLYRQLKKQFHDKDKVLSKARHALFHSEEKRLKIEKGAELESL